MAKVMKKEAWHYAKARSSLRRTPVPEHLFPSIYPQNQSLFYALTYTSDFTGGLPHNRFSQRCSSKAIKIPGCDKSVSAYGFL